MNPALREEWEKLQKKLRQKSPHELEKELQKQIAEKLTVYLAAIPPFYLELHKYQRAEGATPIIWQEGSSCLYAYKQKPAEKSCPSPILIIPSLINRHYILDLEEGNSFVKYLAENGVDTYLASWGEPQDSELEFSLDDYIGRVQNMIDKVYTTTGKKIILTGYCMGGLLALAAALGRNDKILAMAFLATPWDFHAGDFPRFRFSHENILNVEAFMATYSKIPAALMQALFYYMYANLIGHKFETHPGAPSPQESHGRFIAVENWVNDGISMTRKVAKECFIDWVHHNSVAQLAWKSHGSLVSPIAIGSLPAFFAIPQHDHIVPPACAWPLTEYFANRKVITPSAGHVGMIVGKHAKTRSWAPFLKWVQSL